jgi:hypothetical protein
MGRCGGSEADRDRGDRALPVGEGRGLTPAAAWRLCALAGLATVVASRSFGLIEGLHPPCGDTNGASPIIAFELVRNAAELAQLFGSSGPACAARFGAAQVTALWVDMLAFIPAYAAFLALAALALRPQEGRRFEARLALWTAIAVIAAALLDESEGLVMHQLARGWSNQPAYLFDALFWTVRPKFALLGLVEAALGVLLVLRGGWLPRIAGAVMIAGGAISLWFLFSAPHDPRMMQGHSYAWLALLLVALPAAVRPVLVAGHRRG